MNRTLVDGTATAMVVLMGALSPVTAVAVPEDGMGSETTDQVDYDVNLVEMVYGPEPVSKEEAISSGVATGATCGQVALLVGGMTYEIVRRRRGQYVAAGSVTSPADGSPMAFQNVTEADPQHAGTHPDSAMPSPSTVTADGPRRPLSFLVLMRWCAAGGFAVCLCMALLLAVMDGHALGVLLELRYGWLYVVTFLLSCLVFAYGNAVAGHLERQLGQQRATDARAKVLVLSYALLAGLLCLAWGRVAHLTDYYGGHTIGVAWLDYNDTIARCISMTLLISGVLPSVLEVVFHRGERRRG